MRPYLLALVAVIMIVAGLLLSPPARAQDSDVEATVRANPIMVRLHVLGENVKGCGVVVVFVEIRNLSTKRVTIVDQSLSVTLSAWRILGSLRFNPRVLRAKEVGFSVWILQPTQAGDVALVASVRGLLNGTSLSSVSDEKVLNTRTQCSHKWH